MTELQTTINEATAKATAYDRFGGNDRFSGTKNPDRFFHYNGRCLYLSVVAGVLECFITYGDRDELPL